jgi:hypothetical protein
MEKVATQRQLRTRRFVDDPAVSPEQRQRFAEICRG